MSREELLQGRLHPLGVVVIGWQWVRYAVFGGAISALASGNLDIVLPIVALGALVATPFAFLAWQRFRYRVDGDRLVVERGVLVEQERVVPLDRIRGVDISAPLLHRMLGIVQVSVDAAAAGGGGSELTLAAVTREQAEDLREQVLRRQTGQMRVEGQPAREAPTIARVDHQAEQEHEHKEGAGVEGVQPAQNHGQQRQRERLGVQFAQQWNGKGRRLLHLHAQRAGRFCRRR